MRPRPLLCISVWTGGLAVAIVVLGRAGQGALAPPPLDVRAWEGWVQGRGSVESAFALLLLATRVTACYLLGATVLSALASLSGRRWLATAASRLSVPVLPRLVAGALGVAVVGAAPGGPWAGGGEATAPAMVLVVSAGPASGADPPVMHRLEVEPAPAPVPVPVPAPVAEPVARDWELAAGDHLWSVAERVLHTAWGRAPTDREVVPYWSRLVDDNRPRLADPANPDLVFPGQVVALPAPPTAP